MDKLSLNQSGKLRKLKRHEQVPLNHLGVPGYCLAGPQARVVEYDDGHVEPVIESLPKLMRLVCLDIVLNRSGVMTKDQFRFVRRHLKLTQDQAGQLLGINRCTVNRYETGQDKLSASISDALRLQAIRALLLPMEKTSKHKGGFSQPGRAFDHLAKFALHQQEEYARTGYQLIADVC